MFLSEAKAQATAKKVNDEADHLRESLTEKVSDSREALRSMAKDGGDLVGDAANAVVEKSRKGVRDLDRRWRRMNGKEKVAVAGGIVAVIAAVVAAPVLARSLRQRRKA